jgi:hypothetical protein
MEDMFLWPEDEEVKDFDSLIEEIDSRWLDEGADEWKAAVATYRLKLQAWREYKNPERLFIEAEKKRHVGSKRISRAQRGTNEMGSWTG